MIENAQAGERTEREELNRIAFERSTDQTLPPETSWEDVARTCEAISEQLTGRIETYVTETPLTQQEAEVWVLRNTVNEQRVRLTYGAIALALTAPDSPFGVDQEPGGEAESDSLLTITEIKDCYARAEQKYEQARNLVGASTFYNRDEMLDSPAIVWLDHATIDRLRSQSQGHSDERTLDDAVTQLLSETESWITLEELGRAYLTAHDEQTIAQIVLHEGTAGSTLWFRAYGPMEGDLPEDIAEADAIEVDGERYEFHFDQDPHWPADGGGMVTLYSADWLDDVETVSLEDGIEAVRDRVKEAAEQGGFDSLAEQ